MESHFCAVKMKLCEMNPLSVAMVSTEQRGTLRVCPGAADPQTGIYLFSFSFADSFCSLLSSYALDRSLFPPIGSTAHESS